MTIQRMLIDASHPEETRVVVVKGNRLEDFDVEVESRRQLKGNIYLAKVTRVEPSLQAAFVDYGGNRHGFLAFNEIHPDYYQIPVADREALIAEQKADSTEDGDEEGGTGEGSVETLGGDDLEEVEARRPAKLRRHYKIQEVIKRRQILLVQVVKEERGTKGAALTTYLSLAGRYCVLMPNTARGGGISRKISNANDRKRLKSIVGDLGTQEGMAVIVRTAGAKRSKSEIKRDYEYLLRLWHQVRELTLESIAPCLVHEEGDLIKRSIRDLYNKDIDEVIVAGEDGYRRAKDFMKLLIPSHAKRVQPDKESGVPLMQRYQVENQLAAIHSPEVQLKSGGYIVINPTEALVSIDVNSGKATRERNIEETALRTNLEAAEEIARQLKLRDLAGLIVVDFIDMEVNRNQSRVERQLKDAMRSDRARIQIGRISPFGLLELSRQRLRPSLIETSSEPCPHCAGTGIRRSTDSTALHVLRGIEEECMKRKAETFTCFVPTAVALYLLNQKRAALAEIEQRYETTILIENDDSLIPPDFRIERDGDSGERASSDRGAETPEREGSEEEGGKRRRRRRGRRRGRRGDSDQVSEEAPQEENAAASEDGSTEKTDSGDDEDGGKRRRRGRRGGRRRGRKPADDGTQAEAQTQQDGEAATEAADEQTGEPALLEAPAAPELLEAPAETEAEVIPLPDRSGDGEAEAEEKPKRRRRRRKLAANEDAAVEASEEEAPPARKRRSRKAKKPGDDTEEASSTGIETAEQAEAGTTETPADSEAESGEKKRSRRRRAKPKPEAEASEPIVREGAPEPADPESPPEPAIAESQPEEDPERLREAAKTVVINVGGGEGDAEPKPAKRGWWNR